jgi:hypothetical protein
MNPPPLYPHPFTLTLHTSNPTPPTVQEAFDLIIAHRIEGATPAQIANAQTLGGTLRALSVHASEGQAKSTRYFQRPSRKQYRQMLKRMVRVLDFTDELSMNSLAELVMEAKTLLQK